MRNENQVCEGWGARQRTLLGGGVILKDDLSGATGQSQVRVCARGGVEVREVSGVLVHSGHLSGSRRAK